MCKECSNFRNSADVTNFLNINSVSVFIGNLLVEISTLQTKQILAIIC